VSQVSQVLKDAEAVVNGPRQAQYGDPVVTCERIGMAWAAILGLPGVTAKEVALMMAALKLVREAGEEHHYDNLVDAAGYVAIAHRAAVEEDEAELDEAYELARDEEVYDRVAEALDRVLPTVIGLDHTGSFDQSQVVYDDLVGHRYLVVNERGEDVDITDAVRDADERAREQACKDTDEIREEIDACSSQPFGRCCLEGVDDRGAELCRQDQAFGAALDERGQEVKFLDAMGYVLKQGDFVSIVKADFNEALAGKVGEIVGLEVSPFGDIPRVAVKLPEGDRHLVQGSNPLGHVFLDACDVEGLPF
jgi:hypothetical protein